MNYRATPPHVQQAVQERHEAITPQRGERVLVATRRPFDPTYWEPIVRAQFPDLDDEAVAAQVEAVRHNLRDYPEHPPLGDDGLMTSEVDEHVYLWQSGTVQNVERHVSNDSPDPILAVVVLDAHPDLPQAISVALIKPNLEGE